MIEYRSDTFGLWWRLLTKLITAWVTVFFGTWFLFALLPAAIPSYVFFIVLLLLMSVATWRPGRDNPLRWQHRVVFDLQREVIRIYDNKQDTLGADLLDFEGREISFGSIDSYSFHYYESFLFSAYYLVKIYERGQEVKLVSFRNADDFTHIVGLLKGRLQLKVQ